jgi:hypothetical protein
MFAGHLQCSTQWEQWSCLHGWTRDNPALASGAGSGEHAHVMRQAELRKR